MDYRRLRRDDEDEPTNMWLEFQVCSDGLTPHSPPPTPASFPRFADLPTELRLQIWTHLLLPRTVVLTCLTTATAASKRAQLALRPSLGPIPVLLHICAETRRLALPHYNAAQPAFAWRIPSTSRTAPARVYFDFARDTLLLLGELEPRAARGSCMSAPMVYFLDKADARRVVNVAVALEEVLMAEQESNEISATFDMLFHVLDAFPAAARLLVTSTDEDLVRRSGGVPVDLGVGRSDNIVAKIWSAWVNGVTIVTSQLRDKQILMVREDGLADFVADCR